jgi:hypothetical protein
VRAAGTVAAPEPAELCPIETLVTERASITELDLAEACRTETA